MSALGWGHSMPLQFAPMIWPAAFRFFGRRPKRVEDHAIEAMKCVGKHEYDKAITHYTEALRRNPNDAILHMGRGCCWHFKGQWAKAIADYSEAIRLNPKDASAFSNRAAAWRRIGESDKALADDAEAKRLAPRDAVAFFRDGCMWSEKGENDKAIDEFTEAIRLGPDFCFAYFHRASVWLRKGDFDKAEADLTEAIRLHPKDASFFLHRGLARQSKGEHDKALADYTDAISLDKDLVFALDRRAWLLATCTDSRFRNGSEAVIDATRACELSRWKVSSFIATLGASYAESGDFRLAIESLKRAMSMDETENDLRAKMLALFEARKSYRTS
jgi:tetratricopeptide (TPR) repeat protein